MPDGRITYLFDVELVAAGKTYAQLRAELRGQLNRYFIDPQITVVGRSFAGNSVFVMGPISKPGPHAIQNDTRLLDILATAGVLGMQPEIDKDSTQPDRRREAVDLKSAYIARGDEILDVDFHRLLISRDLTQNILLKPKDFIFIPSTYGTEKKVYLCGRVGSPMVRYFTGTLGLMEALVEAGGTDADGGTKTGTQASDTARARGIYIVRKSAKKPMRVDWAAIQMGKIPDVMLENGDIVYVPERSLNYASRVTTNVIREMLSPLKAVLEMDNTAKDYYRHDWEFRK